VLVRAGVKKIKEVRENLNSWTNRKVGPRGVKLGTLARYLTYNTELGGGERREGGGEVSKGEK